MGPGEDIDRVELNHPDLVEDLPEVARTHLAGGSGVSKALCGKGVAFRLLKGDPFHLGQISGNPGHRLS